MVDAEIKAVLIICRNRSESKAGIDRPEAGIFDCADSIAGGDIVEIAAYYHIRAAIMTDKPHQHLSLPGTFHISHRKLMYQMSPDILNALALQIGEIAVKFAVGFG